MLRAVPTAEKLEVLADLWDRGALRAVIDRRFPLDEVVPAMRYLEDGHSHGKTVLVIATQDGTATSGDAGAERGTR